MPKYSSRLPDLIRTMEPGNFLDEIDQIRRKALKANTTAMLISQYVPLHSHTFQDIYLSNGMVIAGGLSVTGSLGLTGNLWISGNASILGALTAGTLNLTHLSACTGSFSGSIHVGGAASMSGSLYVGGAASVVGDLWVGGSSNLSSGSTFVTLSTCSASISGSLWVGGAASIGGRLLAGSDLNVMGSASVQGAASVFGNLFAASHFRAASSASISGSLNVGAATNFGAAASVQGAASVFGNFFAASHFMAGSSASISGSLHVGSNASIAGSAIVLGNMSIGSNPGLARLYIQNGTPASATQIPETGGSEGIVLHVPAYHAALTLISSSADWGIVNFGKTSNPSNAWVGYNQATSLMHFGVEGTGILGLGITEFRPTWSAPPGSIHLGSSAYAWTKLWADAASITNAVVIGGSTSITGMLRAHDGIQIGGATILRGDDLELGWRYAIATGSYFDVMSFDLVSGGSTTFFSSQATGELLVEFIARNTSGSVVHYSSIYHIFVAQTGACYINACILQVSSTSLAFAATAAPSFAFNLRQKAGATAAKLELEAAITMTGIASPNSFADWRWIGMRHGTAAAHLISPCVFQVG